MDERAAAQRCGAQEEARHAMLESLSSELRAFHADAAMLSQVVAERLGIAASDLQCLNVLGNAGPVPAGRLAELTGLATATVTGVVDRLEAAGYVRRERDDTDRRRVIVTPQPVVWERISPLFASVRRATTALCDRYDDDQLAAILDFVTASRTLMAHETVEMRERGSVHADPPPWRSGPRFARTPGTAPRPPSGS